MEFSYQIRFHAGEKEFEWLDAYQGARSVSALTRIFYIGLHAFLHEELVKHATSARGIRISYGKSRDGSLIQTLNVLIADPIAQTVAFGAAGAAVGNLISDFTKWLIRSCVGTRDTVLKRKTNSKILKIQRSSDEDIEEILFTSIREAHAPVKHQGLKVTIYFNRTPIMELNKDTLDYLETEILAEETEIFDVAVSRFNARTGTGRFITSLESESIPFRPVMSLSDDKKVILSNNLTLISEGIFEPIRVEVKIITSNSGRIKYYLLHDVFDV